MKPVQFWALIVWTVALLMGGFVVASMGITTFRSAQSGGDWLVGSLLLAIASAIALFGMLHLKRALTGRFWRC